jgi:hypothetical protein
MNVRDDATRDLFASIPKAAPAEPGTMDHRVRLSELVGQMIADWRAAHGGDGLDRYDLAARMSRLTDHDVSKPMLDGYTARAREAFNLPYWLVPALETACESTALTEWLAAQRGGRVLWGPAALDAEIGRLRAEETDSRDRRRALEQLRKRVR